MSLDGQLWRLPMLASMGLLYLAHRC